MDSIRSPGASKERKGEGRSVKSEKARKVSGAAHQKMMVKEEKLTKKPEKAKPTKVSVPFFSPGIFTPMGLGKEE